MTRWQYARLIIRYEGERTEVVRRFWSPDEQRKVHTWRVRWAGPNDQKATERVVDGEPGTAIRILNEYGIQGWDVIHATHGDRVNDYLLKRPQPGQR